VKSSRKLTNDTVIIVIDFFHFYKPVHISIVLLKFDGISKLSTKTNIALIKFKYLM